MRIGVYRPEPVPMSVRGYAEQVVGALVGLGVAVEPFADGRSLPSGVDLLWDPGGTDGGLPPASMRRSPLPVVSTVHGFASGYLGGKLPAPPSQRLRHAAFTRRRIWAWRGYRHRVARVITVSEYAKHEICSHLGIDPRKVDVAYHGADRLFYEVSPIVREGEPYLLHVSAAQAKKNIDRLLAAYERLEVADKPRLVVVAPGLMRDLPVSGVDVIRRPMTHWELAPLYAGAVAFVFPSLHETFGMPILEAMAAGCPVITSSSTACPEIAGGCALLVDPWSVEDIAAGMRRLLDDEGLRSTLGRRGRERARAFTWDRSAAAHLAAFHRALS